MFRNGTSSRRPGRATEMPSTIGGAGFLAGRRLPSASLQRATAGPLRLTGGARCRRYGEDLPDPLPGDETSTALTAHRSGTGAVRHGRFERKPVGGPVRRCLKVVVGSENVLGWDGRPHPLTPGTVLSTYRSVPFFPLNDRGTSQRLASRPRRFRTKRSSSSRFFDSAFGQHHTQKLPPAF